MNKLNLDKVGYNKYELNVSDSIMEDSVATVNENRSDAKQWANLFQKAPEMLDVIKSLRDNDEAMKNIDDATKNTILNILKDL